jgi:tetratricopeptide (TPR) repeat protein
MLMRGVARTTRGELDEGRAEMAAGRSLLHEIGDRLSWAGSSMVEAETELAVGRTGRAYELLTEGHAFLAESAETGFLATVVALRAQAALELGRDDEALELAEEVQAIAARDDVDPHARERFVRAVVLARRGDFAGADELLAASATIVDPTDYAILHFDLAIARSEVARLARRPDEQRASLEEALTSAEAKGSVVAADRVRAALAAL